jgi:hypothetical protein
MCANGQIRLYKQLYDVHSADVMPTIYINDWSNAFLNYTKPDTNLSIVIVDSTVSYVINNTPKHVLNWLHSQMRISEIKLPLSKFVYKWDEILI